MDVWIKTVFVSQLTLSCDEYRVGESGVLDVLLLAQILLLFVNQALLSSDEHFGAFDEALNVSVLAALDAQECRRELSHTLGHKQTHESNN